MPKLDTFEIEIETTDGGPTQDVKYKINGFPLNFDQSEGGTGPGETLKAAGSPQSFPHTLLLCGPSSGTWNIAGIRLTYHCAGMAPYAARLGAVTLDDSSDLNIWHEQRASTIDV